MSQSGMTTAVKPTLFTRKENPCRGVDAGRTINQRWQAFDVDTDTQSDLGKLYRGTGRH